MEEVIAKLIEAVAGKGGTIIASKDLHPHDHCSFGHTTEKNCKNKKDYNDNNLTMEKRYVNAFPSHCSFNITDGWVVPQGAPDTPFCKGLPPAHRPPFCAQSDYIGAELTSGIEAAMTKVAKGSQQLVYQVFKGIHHDYDSFSAMPHKESKGSVAVSADETAYTGGFALPTTRDQACKALGNFNAKECYPKKSEIDNVGKDGGLVPIASILKQRSINHVIVVGLVYDFCVKETALFAQELDTGTDIKIQVPAGLVRPSFDGKPGSPYTNVACVEPDGKVPNFCKKGGGTTPLLQSVAQDLKDGKVSLINIIQPS